MDVPMSVQLFPVGTAQEVTPGEWTTAGRSAEMAMTTATMTVMTET